MSYYKQVSIYFDHLMIKHEDGRLSKGQIEFFTNKLEQWHKIYFKRIEDQGSAFLESY